MIVPKIAIDTEAVSRHYDQLDVFYRDIWGEHVHHGLWLTGREDSGQATRQLVEHIAGLAGIRRGDSVCDVGSGYGATARLLVAERGAEVTALTVTPRQHDYA